MQRYRYLSEKAQTTVGTDGVFPGGALAGSSVFRRGLGRYFQSAKLPTAGDTDPLITPRAAGFGMALGPATPGFVANGLQRIAPGVPGKAAPGRKFTT